MKLRARTPGHKRRAAARAAALPDDAPNIQALIDGARAAGATVVHVPGGRISSPITVPPNMTLCGLSDCNNHPST